jgi:large conductance mechanosensitive channel
MVRRGSSAAGGFLAGFRDFIMRGNVVDLAVAVVLGGAFGKIVESLVADLITPAILNPAMKAAGVDKLSELSAGGIQYGLFLAAVLNFLVIALCIYVLIQAFEKAKRRFMREEAAAAPEADPVLVSQERLTNAMERLADTMQNR